jgi:hypothetical protein
MKVKDLVKLLLDCDQEKTVFLWEDSYISQISTVDELTDRVDLQTNDLAKHDEWLKQTNKEIREGNV